MACAEEASVGVESRRISLVRVISRKWKTDKSAADLVRKDCTSD
jgi:hypothetical protein